MRSIRVWIARRILNLIWGWIVVKGPAEPVTNIRGRKIEWELVEPDRERERSDRHWDDSIYLHGNIYIDGYANPIEVVEDNVEEIDPEDLDEDEDEVPDVNERIHLYPSDKYRALLKNHVIQQVFSTGLRKLALYILIMLVVVAVLLGGVIMWLLSSGAI